MGHCQRLVVLSLWHPMKPLVEKYISCEMRSPTLRKVAALWSQKQRQGSGAPQAASHQGTTTRTSVTSAGRWCPISKTTNLPWNLTPLRRRLNAVTVGKCSGRGGIWKNTHLQEPPASPFPVRSLLFVTSARENLRQAQLWKGIPWNTRVRGHINANVCNKLFGRGTDLRGHLRIHTRERPCSCTMCGKKFYSWLKLNRHKNIHAREASRTSKKDSAQSHSGSNTAEIIK